MANRLGRGEDVSTRSLAAEARQAVLRRLAERQDYFATEEQLLRAKGEVTAAEGAHKYALWVLRAYRVELDDPAPIRRQS